MHNLDDRWDAFGHVLYDRYQGRESFSIVERDDGYVDVDHLTPTYFADYADWPRHERQAVQLASGRVLDIGCGAGRAALYVQRKGLAVLGLDVSPLAVKVCQLRGLRQAKVLSITQVHRKLGTFDTILMLGNNFGLFSDPGRARWLLRRFWRTTSAQGKIIAETLDPYRTTEPPHLDYHRRNRRRGRMAGQVRIRIRYKRYASRWFDYLFVSKDELQKLLDGTGWRVRRFIDSQGPAYVAVIEKDR